MGAIAALLVAVLVCRNRSPVPVRLVVSEDLLELAHRPPAGRYQLIVADGAQLFVLVDTRTGQTYAYGASTGKKWHPLPHLP